MVRRPALLVLGLIAALLAAACTDSAGPSASSNANDSDKKPQTTEPQISAQGFELVTPDPDPTLIESSADVRMGMLDNGLTYYVQSNQAPGSGLSLRLVVDAGSMQQEVVESGSAHFLEHMLFNGTENFPGNELARALERIGVQFGADLNAYTSYDETVYQLDLSGITDETIATGFDVLVDWASAATIEQTATEAERGVVREELRLRDEGPDFTVASAFDDAYLTGTPYHQREPAGRADLVLETNAEELREFYDRWYRPDLMAVVAVGDLPLDRLESELVERFEGLEGRSDGTERTTVTAEPIGEPMTDIVTHPELSNSYASVDFSLTNWGLSTVGGERLTLIQELAALMIRNRLDDAADRGELLLDDVNVVRFEQTRIHAFLGFSFEAPDLAVATESVLTELRKIELDGFTSDEYERAAAAFRAGLDQQLASAPSVQDAAHADALAQHFLVGVEISSAADAHRRLTGALDDITASDVTDLYRWEMNQAAPIVLMVGPDATELPTVDQLDAAIAASAANTGTPGGAGSDDDVAIEELMARPDSVEPESESSLAEVAATEWVYANGVTVRFVQSDIATSQVQMLAEGEGGWSQLLASDAALAPYAIEAVTDSGIGEHDPVTARRFLAGTTSQLVPFIDETSEGFVGVSGIEDLEVLFQQFHLAVTAPRVDDRALRQTIDDADASRLFVESDAGSATFEAIANVRFDGDPRFSLIPPPLDDLTADRALAIYRERLGAVDDLVVAIAGDISESTIEELASAYLGTLPARPVDSWLDVRPDPVDDVIRRNEVAGSGESTGTVAVLYPSALDIDAQRRVELLVLERIFGARILDVVREELGASYGGSASLDPVVAPVEGVDALLFANIDPDRGDEIVEVLLAEATDLAANGPTSDELERARSVLRSDFDLVSNGDLIDLLLTDDEEPLTYPRQVGLLSEVTAGSIRNLAARVFPDDVRVEVLTVPA